MNKEELKECLRQDRKVMIKNQKLYHLLYICLLADPEWLRWRYIKNMRKATYYQNLYTSGHKSAIFLMALYTLRRNILGNKLGFEIGPAEIGPGLMIYHNGPIVIHGGTKIGTGCILHGDNCIGNNGNDNYTPVIGDSVDIGVGAKILGNIRIANDIKVGAGAVVVHSFEEPGITIAGVPARRI